MPAFLGRVFVSLRVDGKEFGYFRLSRAGGNLENALCSKIAETNWFPACAGMTISLRK